MVLGQTKKGGSNWGPQDSRSIGTKGGGKEGKMVPHPKSCPRWLCHSACGPSLQQILSSVPIFLRSCPFSLPTQGPLRMETPAPQQHLEKVRQFPPLLLYSHSVLTTIKEVGEAEPEPRMTKPTALPP